jgi:hypothetical protein
MIKLTYKARQELSSTDVQMKIAVDCNKALQTVTKWIKHGHENLTKKHVIKSIVKHTKLDENGIFD